MSEHKPDERDIDDILASIDEMLQEKDAFPAPAVPKKAKVKQALQQSEQTLALSSTPLTMDNDVEDEAVQENITSRHRVLLTEALLEKNAQAVLPLWVEQTQLEEGDTTQDAAECEAGTSQVVAKTIEKQSDPDNFVEPDAQLGDFLRINREQLEALVEVVSRDVSRQINQQTQKLLPKLLRASLVRHLASLKKDNE